MKTSLLLTVLFMSVVACQQPDSGNPSVENPPTRTDSAKGISTDDTLTPHESNKAGETEFDWNPESVARQETTPSLPSSVAGPDPFLPPVPVQSYSLDATQDQILTLKGGTLLGFEAGSFEQNGKPVSGPVTIEVKEYTQLSDFLADGMSTVSNGQLLETGGSLDVSAAFKGQKCELAKGKPLRIAFRRNAEVEGMETFVGNRTNDGRMNWVRDIIPPTTYKPEQETTDNGSDQISEELPVRNAGILDQKKLREYLFTHLQSPPFLREFTISGQCDLEIETDESGCFRSVCVRKSVHPLYDKALQHNLVTCPFPISTSRQKASYPFTIQIRNQLVNAFDHSPSVDKQYNRILNQTKTSQCLTSTPLNDGIVSFQKSLDQKMGEMASQSVKQADKGFYFMVSFRIGPINCDHELDLRAPKTNLVVDVHSYTKPRLFLVLKGKKTMVEAGRFGSHWAFYNIPIGENVDVFGYSMDGDQPYFSSSTLKVKKKSALQLDLLPIPSQKLKSEIQHLSEEFARL